MTATLDVIDGYLALVRRSMRTGVSIGATHYLLPRVMARTFTALFLRGL